MEQNGTRSDGLTPKQLQAITALLTHPTLEQAAQAIHVGRTTLYAWLEDPVFKTELRQAKQLILEEVASQMVALTQKALEVTWAILSDDKQKAVTRLRAASIVLAHVIPLSELYDHEARILALEREQHNAKQWEEDN